MTGGKEKPGAAVVVRLKTDGSLDTSFNGNGVSVLMNNGSPFVSLDHSIGRAIDYRASDGALVISGSYKPSSSQPVTKDDPALFVAAFDNGGGLNHSFNNVQGVYTPELQVGSREYATSYAVKFDAVGRIVWGGEIVDINTTDHIRATYQVVGRLNANGTPDVSFGDHGLNANGTPDVSFGVDGVAVEGGFDLLQNVRAVSLQPEGFLVTAGAYDTYVRRARLCPEPLQRRGRYHRRQRRRPGGRSRYARQHGVHAVAARRRRPGAARLLSDRGRQRGRRHSLPGDFRLRRLRRRPERCHGHGAASDPT